MGKKKTPKTDKEKCFKILDNLMENINLTNELGDQILHNIFLTIYMLLRNSEDYNKELIDVEQLCAEKYKNYFPTEMEDVTIN